MKTEDEVVSDFIYCIWEYIQYWEEMNVPSKRKLEGLAHSILCALDGQSGNFDGDITKLEKSCKYAMLHEELHIKISKFE